MAIPDIAKLKAKSAKNLRNLGLKKVQWAGSPSVLKITLTDG